MDNVPRPSVDATGLAAAILAVVGVGLTGLMTWLIARRKASGRIDTSDASELWQESQAMRADMRQEIVSLRTELAASRKETAELRTELEAARRETRALRTELVTLRKRLAASEGRIDQIEEETHGG